jgi:hypothetical protein
MDENITPDTGHENSSPLKKTFIYMLRIIAGLLAIPFLFLVGLLSLPVFILVGLCVRVIEFFNIPRKKKCTNCSCQKDFS